MAYIGKSPVIGNFVKLDAITAVNGQAAYTMQNGGSNFTDYESVNQFLVSLNGTIQAPTDSFTVSGSTLTFASNLSTGDVIDFIMVFGNSLSAGTPTDATVTKAKLADQIDIFSGTSLNAADLGSGIHIKTADSGASVAANYDELVIENSSHAGMSILTGTSSVGAVRFGDSGDNDIGGVLYDHSNNDLTLKVNATDAAKIDSSANLQFNSGYGSAATAYGVRAWVRFNGSGTLSVQGSGNVTSVTDNGTGDYTLNFTNNMPDTNYTYISTACNDGGDRGTLSLSGTKTVSALRFNGVRFTTSISVVDFNDCNVAILR